LSFGSFILRNPDDGQYALLSLGRPCIIPFSYHDPDTFREEFLSPEKSYLRADGVRELEERLGKLGADEVYVPRPEVIPSRLGTSVLQRENIWEWATRTAAYYGVGRGGVVDAVLPHFKLFDNLDLWRAVTAHVFNELPAGNGILVQIGCCSHWLRPHQTRWTADGGFAWPTGYGSGQGGYGFMSLPQFDWSVMMTRIEERWQLTRDKSARPSLRITIPTRTYRHRQAAIHTLWSIGREKEMRFYGFRRQEGSWQCTAESEWMEDRRAKGSRRRVRVRRRGG